MKSFNFLAALATLCVFAFLATSCNVEMPKKEDQKGNEAPAKKNDDRMNKEEK